MISPLSAILDIKGKRVFISTCLVFPYVSFRRSQEHSSKPIEKESLTDLGRYWDNPLSSWSFFPNVFPWFFQWFFQCRRFLHRCFNPQEGMIFMANFSFTALTDISSLEAPRVVPFCYRRLLEKYEKLMGKSMEKPRKHPGKMMKLDKSMEHFWEILGDNPWAMKKIIWAVAAVTLLGWWLVGGSYYLYRPWGISHAMNGKSRYQPTSNIQQLQRDDTLFLNTSGNWTLAMEIIYKWVILPYFANREITIDMQQ